MKILDLLNKLKEIVINEFPDILLKEPEIKGMKLRIFLNDGSIIDIYYPVIGKYSFHWQKKEGFVRLNTAPNHKEIPTFPRHLHKGNEIIEDIITDLNALPEDNLRRFLKFVVKELGENKTS